jgi:transposase
MEEQAVDGLSGVFSGGASPQDPIESEVNNLHTKIGRLAVENDFLAQGLKR